MAILHFYYYSYYWQINWQIYLPPVESSSGEAWQFYISTIKAVILADHLAGVPPSRVISVVNGNSTFLLLELILADQLADLPPTVRVIVMVAILHF